VIDSFGLFVIVNSFPSYDTEFVESWNQMEQSFQISLYRMAPAPYVSPKLDLTPKFKLAVVGGM
jgi:hypothetical protein